MITRSRPTVWSGTLPQTGPTRSGWPTSPSVPALTLVSLSGSLMDEREKGTACGDCLPYPFHRASDSFRFRAAKSPPPSHRNTSARVKTQTHLIRGGGGIGGRAWVKFLVGRKVWVLRPPRRPKRNCHARH